MNYKFVKAILGF